MILVRCATGVYTADSQRSKTITIDSTNNTLDGLRLAINAANIGATASIVTNAGSAHLVLTSKDPSASNVMKLSGTGTLADFGYDPASIAVSEQRLVSPSNSAYTSANSLIKTGDLKIELGSLSPAGLYTAGTTSATSATITIDNTNNTLGGLRDAINAANMGATASIKMETNATTGADEARLVVTSTSATNVIKFSGTGTTKLTGFDYNPEKLTGFNYDPALNTGTMSQDAAQGGQAATNAAFKLNGVAATSSTNSVTGALDGVTLNLQKTSTVLTPATSGPPATSATYTPTTLTVSTSTSSSTLTNTLTAFVSAYNAANSSMSSLGAYDATTKTAGALQGNSTLRTVKSQIQNLLFNATAGGSSAYQHLTDLGVSLAKDGSLSLDSAKLNAAVAADPSSVANLVAAAGKAYNTAITGMVGTTGSITSASDGANRTIKALTQRQQALTDRLAIIQANYTKQFTALDSLISGMKQTSTYLTQQLANLPGVTSTTK